MVNQSNYWTSPRSDGRWEVKPEGAERASRVFDTQKEAWDQARSFARDRGGEAFLQSQAGTIRERNTYGNDPRKTKG